ncbi:MAG: gamma-glutamyl-gamma-aminobutyrate hydrolase family protein [Gemmatimonadetes bacterium]|nr:gamma-glutamyl-gamma-aminobutyrate hydrolase family protein [Gemmatimonadota bacterium]
MNRVVAVTATRRSEGRERVALNVSYVHALAKAGLVPLLVPSVLEPARAVEALDAVWGLVLTGGEDVDPARYGAAPHPRLEQTDPARDTVEIALLEGARARRLPVLAICRGIQLVNVALGGTLYQDLPTEHPSAIPHHEKAARHGVRVESGSLLHRTLGVTSHTVNSRHHQAIRTLAPGLVATAWAEDGIIEGVEPADPSAPWLVAVQWHPEDLDEAALFRGFAGALG